MFSKVPKKIGLFGGSFNPPHWAHIELAKYSIKVLKLDLLIVIPTYKSIDKPELEYLPINLRLDLLKTALPRKKIIISNFELNLKKDIQSIETIRHFKNLFKASSIYFLLGDDHLPTLHTWENLKEIFSISTVAIFKRQKKINLDNLKSLIGEGLFQKTIFFNNKLFKHSSSDIRASLNTKLFHKKMRKYLQDNNLLKKFN